MSYGEILSSFLIDLQRVFRKKVKIQNASFQQIMALSAIPSKGIEMTPLAKKIGIDNSTATRLIKRLEDNGWVNRVVSPNDKRVIEVRFFIPNIRDITLLTFPSIAGIGLLKAIESTAPAV